MKNTKKKVLNLFIGYFRPLYPTRAPQPPQRFHKVAGDPVEFWAAKGATRPSLPKINLLPLLRGQRRSRGGEYSMTVAGLSTL